MDPKRVYEINIMPQAKRSLKKLKNDRELLERLDNGILSLAENPRPRGYKKLRSNSYRNLYRIRVGDWRIIYAIEDDEVVVLILDVVRRDQAYVNI